jgi:transposase
LKSQRISEFLQILGSEEVQRRFFELYINCLYGTCGTTGILIDSSGMPNASKMSLTQLSNHNGKINMEIRLIYVLDRKTGMPIYFRYCSGNIIDVTTLCTTIAELRQYKIAVDYAIMDAGYFSETNVKELYQSGIPFITRLAPNRKLFKKVVAENLDGLMIARYAVRYGNRLLYIKKVSIMLHLGLFMILSSVDIPVEEILPLYYTRQQIEQVFDIGKNDADLLPIRVQNEDTLRGHLLLTFMATVLLQNLQRDIISRRHKKDKINSEGILMNMRNQKCKAYKSEVIPQEPVKNL